MQDIFNFDTLIHAVFLEEHCGLIDDVHLTSALLTCGGKTTSTTPVIV